MKADDTRAALVGEVTAQMLGDDAVTAVLAAADAYGDARELKGHVEACQESSAPHYGGGDYLRQHKCGEDWLCKRGKELSDGD